jgi:DNA-binding MarR family transcriptional regulator
MEEKMDDFNNTGNQLNECLFFSSCKLARVLGKTADDEFKVTGLSPSHAFLLHIVNNNSGIQQKQIGELLHMTPSTITRFIEKLESKELVVRKSEGKNVYIFNAEKGMKLQSDIENAWARVHDIYADILTEEEQAQFIATTNKIIAKLEK